jgi:hypothetical protein
MLQDAGTGSADEWSVHMLLHVSTRVRVNVFGCRGGMQLASRGVKGKVAGKSNTEGCLRRQAHAARSVGSLLVPSICLCTAHSAGLQQVLS